jgi:hypothetical protein
MRRVASLAQGWHSQECQGRLVAHKWITAPPAGDTTGWYIWAGDHLSDDPTFFVPLHVEHLDEWAPQVLKFLGLAPGWRFLVAGEYEDVWYDPNLLRV